MTISIVISVLKTFFIRLFGFSQCLTCPLMANIGVNYMECDINKIQAIGCVGLQEELLKGINFACSGQVKQADFSRIVLVDS